MTEFINALALSGVCKVRIKYAFDILAFKHFKAKRQKSTDVIPVVLCCLYIIEVSADSTQFQLQNIRDSTKILMKQSEHKRNNVPSRKL